MGIPKNIFQTFKDNKVPWLTKLYIRSFLKKNKDYSYEFYDDKRVSDFFAEYFDERINRAYHRLQIGAAKADFFRYAVLYIYGGIYIDLDSDLLVSIDKYLNDDDVAVITHENNRSLYAQWALIFDKGHPFLKRTMELIVDNIEQNRFPHDVHAMTGPTVYTLAINEVLKENPNVAYRCIEDDYKGLLKFKYKLGKLMIYKDKSNHWKKLQLRIPVVKPDTDF
ncbi:glycosyltransferase family 32 protein [Sphingobacterium sp.]|uniref:glycosyltransferase family 32 protein n=1 Tax=Sphingobacterium sp. TaxID=341027 RepID=UPI002FDEC3EC